MTRSRRAEASYEPGLFLFALELALPHPESGRTVRYAAPEPAKFATWRARERRRWLRYHPVDCEGRAEVDTPTTDR